MLHDPGVKSEEETPVEETATSSEGTGGGEEKPATE